MLRKLRNRILGKSISTSSIMLMLMIVYSLITDALLIYEASPIVSFVIKLTSCAFLLWVGTFCNNKFREREKESKRGTCKKHVIHIPLSQ